MPYNIISLSEQVKWQQNLLCQLSHGSLSRNNPIGRPSNIQDASTASFNASRLGGNKDRKPQNSALACDSIFRRSFPSLSYSSLLNLPFS